MASASTSPTSQSGLVDGRRCTFVVHCHDTRPGETLVLVGESVALGHWQVSAGLAFTTTPSSWPRWEASVPIQLPRVAFKLLVRSSNGISAVRWEPLPHSSNRAWPDVLAPGSVISFSWGFPNIYIQAPIPERNSTTGSSEGSLGLVARPERLPALLGSPQPQDHRTEVCKKKKEATADESAAADEQDPAARDLLPPEPGCELISFAPATEPAASSSQELVERKKSAKLDAEGMMAYLCEFFGLSSCLA